MPNPTAYSTVSAIHNNLVPVVSSPAMATLQNSGVQTWFPLNPQRISMPANPAGLVTTQGNTSTPSHPNWFQTWWQNFQNWEQSSDFQNSWFANFQHLFGFRHPLAAQAAANSGGSTGTAAQAPTPVALTASPAALVISNTGSGPEDSGSSSSSTDETSSTPSGMGQYLATNAFPFTSAGQAGVRGLGCDCGCGSCGMGTLGDGTGFLSSGLFNGQGVMGSGLFESGWDVTSWGPAEWAVVAIGGYVVFSTIWTTNKAMEYGSFQKKRVRAKVKKATTFNLLGM